MIMRVVQGGIARRAHAEEAGRRWDDFRAMGHTAGPRRLQHGQDNAADDAPYPTMLVEKASKRDIAIIAYRHAGASSKLQELSPPRRAETIHAIGRRVRGAGRLRLSPLTSC